MDTVLHTLRDFSRLYLNVMGSTVTYLRGTPGPNGFGSASTAEDVTEGLNLQKYTALITGATSGIGFETTRVLAKRGARIVMAAITVKEGEEAKAKILEETPSARLVVMQLDLGNLRSVRNFAANFNESKLPLNILVNNAGISLSELRETPDGLELTFAVNFLGHFLLTDLLLDSMRATTKESSIQGRIVNVSGGVYAALCPKGGIIFEDLVNYKGSYYGGSFYAQSKLALILHCLELSCRLEEGANITANMLHPGAIRLTNLVNWKGFRGFIKDNIPNFVWKTIEQGAATQVYVATNPRVEGQTGKYYADCQEYPLEGDALNTELQAKLWKWAEKYISTH